MSWLELRSISLAELARRYHCCNRYLQTGYRIVPDACQDGAVALSLNVNQVLLLDLESGDIRNLEICG